MTTLLRKSLAAGLVVAAMLLSGCQTPGPGLGTLAVQLVDTPAPGIKELNVKINRIQVKIDESWVTVGPIDQTVNLLDYRRVPYDFGEITYGAGERSGVRLIIYEDPTVVDEDGTHVVDLVRKQTTADITHWIFVSGRWTLIVDFNVAESLIKHGPGDYSLDPVIRGGMYNTHGQAEGVVKLAGSPGVVPEAAEIKAVYLSGGQAPADSVINTSSVDTNR
jgi:hypothetical protein